MVTIYSYLGSTKFGFTGLVLLICFFTFPACSTSNHLNGTKEGGSEMEEMTNHSSINNVSRNIDLTTHLKRISGVRVSGDGPDAVVTVRDGSASTFYSNTTPIFVVDGQTMNVSYSQLYSMVNAYRIAKIEVLKGAEAGIYGVRGANGAIVITSER